MQAKSYIDSVEQLYRLKKQHWIASSKKILWHKKNLHYYVMSKQVVDFCRLIYHLFFCNKNKPEWNKTLFTEWNKTLWHWSSANFRLWRSWMLNKKDWWMYKNPQNLCTTKIASHMSSTFVDFYSITCWKCRKKSWWILVSWKILVKQTAEIIWKWKIVFYLERKILKVDKLKI